MVAGPAYTVGKKLRTPITLSKKRMIIKDTKHRGVYFLNPEYFFKGSISDRTKVIKNIIEYQIA